MVIAAFCFAWVASIAAGVYVARVKGRPTAEGLLLAAALGPFGVIVAALLPAVPVERFPPKRFISDRVRR